MISEEERNKIYVNILDARYEAKKRAIEIWIEEGILWNEYPVEVEIDIFIQSENPILGESVMTPRMRQYFHIKNYMEQRVSRIMGVPKQLGKGNYVK